MFRNMSNLYLNKVRRCNTSYSTYQPNLKSGTLITLHSASRLTIDEFLNVVLCYLPDYLKLFSCNSLLFCYLFIQVAFISITFYLLLCCIQSESNPLWMYEWLSWKLVPYPLVQRFEINGQTYVIYHPPKQNKPAKRISSTFCVRFSRCHWQQEK